MKHTKLKILLHRRGLSQQEVLEMINNHKQEILPYQLSKMINGKSEPSTLKTLRLLKNTFELDYYDQLIDD